MWFAEMSIFPPLQSIIDSMRLLDGKYRYMFIVHLLQMKLIRSFLREADILHMKIYLMTSPMVPGAMPAALDSSVSMCIASA